MYTPISSAALLLVTLTLALLARPGAAKSPLINTKRAINNPKNDTTHARGDCVVVLGGRVACVAPGESVSDDVWATLQEMVLWEKKHGHVTGEPQALGPVGPVLPADLGKGEAETEDEVQAGSVEVAPVVLPKTVVDKIARPHYRWRGGRAGKIGDAVQ